jgi:Transposase DDE domain
MSHPLTKACQKCAAASIPSPPPGGPLAGRIDPTEDADWQQVLSLFPSDLETTARASKALQRRRAIRSATDLLRLILVYVLWDWSLNLVGAWAASLGLASLSDVAILHRLENALSWLQTLITALVDLPPVGGPPVGGPPARVRLRIVDASVISKPGSTGTDWRLHLSWDLGQARIAGGEVTDVHGGETLVRYPLQPDEITVGDRGYAHPRGLGHHLAGGGGVVVRMHYQNLPLHDAQGRTLAVVPWLRTLPATAAAERPVWVPTPQGTFRMRLIVRQLSPEVAEAARRRLRQQARKKGRTPTAASLDAAGYLTVVTNLDPRVWPADLVLQLYRLRWQIELTFKRLKGLIALDALRARTTKLPQVYLLGKLVGALLIERVHPPAPAVWTAWFAASDRPISLWRWLAWWTEAVRTAVRGPLTLARIAGTLPVLDRYLCDSPRRRRQQAAFARLLLQTGPPLLPCTQPTAPHDVLLCLS